MADLNVCCLREDKKPKSTRVDELSRVWVHVAWLECEHEFLSGKRRVRVPENRGNSPKFAGRMRDRRRGVCARANNEGIGTSISFTLV